MSVPLCLTPSALQLTWRQLSTTAQSVRIVYEINPSPIRQRPGVILLVEFGNKLGTNERSSVFPYLVYQSVERSGHTSVHRTSDDPLRIDRTV